MSAAQFHRVVVDDVIKNMRAEFANEGLDDQVLEDLKQMWETKMMQAGVYDYPSNAVPVQSYAYDTLNYTSYMDPTHTQQSNLLPMTQNQMYTHTMASYLPQNPVTTARQTNPAHAVALNALRNLNNQQASPSPLPLPPQTQTHHLSNTLPTVSSTTYGYDATGKPQQYMQPPGSIVGWNTQPTTTTSNTSYMTNIRQQDGANDEVTQDRQKIDAILLKKFKRAQKQKQLFLQQNKKTKETPQTSTEKTIPQFDGLGDRKNDEDDLDDDDDDDEVKAEGDEELGSDLDDEEEDEEPDTEHIVLCQYEKVSRVKNKRKANLKDGIMHINGRDFVFSKATGEFDW